jgi:hypothetical protein
MKNDAKLTPREADLLSLELDSPAAGSPFSRHELGLYFAGALDNERKTAFEEWLAHDPKLKDFVETTMRETREQLSREGTAMMETCRQVVSHATAPVAPPIITRVASAFNVASEAVKEELTAFGEWFVDMPIPLFAKCETTRGMWSLEIADGRVCISGFEDASHDLLVAVSSVDPTLIGKTVVISKDGFERRIELRDENGQAYGEIALSADDRRRIVVEGPFSCRIKRQ